MSQLLTDFISDLSGDPRKIQALGVGEAYLASLRAEAALGTSRTWLLVEPVQAPDGWSGVRERAAVVTSRYVDGRVNRPTALRMVGDEYWVSSQINEGISRFDADWSFLGQARIPFTPPQNPDSIALWIGDFAVDADAVYLATGIFQQIQAVRRSDGALLWEFGTQFSAGAGGSGKLNYPAGVELLPDGTLLCSSRDGHELVRLDPTDGSYIDSPIIGQGNGWEGRVNAPCHIRTGPDGLVYVASRDGQQIAAFDSTAWGPAVETYTTPRGWDVAEATTTSCAVADGILYAAVENIGTVVGVGVTDHDYRSSVGRIGWDARQGAKNLPGEMMSPVAVLPVEPGWLAVADRDNNRVQLVPTEHYQPVPYQVDLPAGYRLVEHALPPGYDPATHTLTVPLPRIREVGPLYLPLERVC